MLRSRSVVRLPHRIGRSSINCSNSSIVMHCLNGGVQIPYHPFNAYSNNSALTRRHFCSKEASTNDKLISATPPFIVSAAIVGSSVGLASPFFALGGVGYMWFNYLPKSILGKIVKYGLAVGVGGGVTILIQQYVGPFLWNNADFVLPFAAANGVAATTWYATAYAAFGATAVSGTVGANSAVYSTLMRIGGLPLASLIKTIPVAGPVIGALTAITAPFLWPTMFAYCWSADYQQIILGSNPAWISHMYEWIALPVGLPVGILSGAMMHLLLKPVIFGKGGSGGGGGGGPWTRRAFPVLLSLVTASGLYFTTRRAEPNELLWYRRIDPLKGTYRSYNARTGEYRDDSSKTANAVSFKRAAIRTITSTLRDPFDRSGGGSLTQTLADQQNDDATVDEDIATGTTTTPSVPSVPDTDTFVVESTLPPSAFDRKLKQPSILDLPELVLFHRLLDILVRSKHLELAQKTPVVQSAGERALRAAQLDRLLCMLDEQLGLKMSAWDIGKIARDLEMLIVIQRQLAVKTSERHELNTNNNNNEQMLVDLREMRCLLRRRVLDAAVKATSASTNCGGGAPKEDHDKKKRGVSAGTDNDWGRFYWSASSSTEPVMPSGKHLMALLVDHLHLLEKEYLSELHLSVRDDILEMETGEGRPGGGGVTQKLKSIQNEIFWENVATAAWKVGKIASVTGAVLCVIGGAIQLTKGN